MSANVVGKGLTLEDSLLEISNIKSVVSDAVEDGVRSARHQTGTLCCRRHHRGSETHS
jgi:hypothetical protein